MTPETTPPDLPSNEEQDFQRSELFAREFAEGSFSASQSGLTAVPPPHSEPPVSSSEVKFHKSSLLGTPTNNNSAGAFSQAVFFLLAMGTMLAAARYAMPTIVEEIRYAWHRGQLRAQYEESGDGLKNVSLAALSDAYQMVTDRVGPSVVHIDVRRSSPSHPVDVANFVSGDFDELIPLSDQGSGVIVDAEGFIVTNRHVIADGDAILVGLSDGRRLPARVIGTDALTDIALLKIEANKLLPIDWGDSDLCNVGAPVWAVGSPFGLDRTVTFGILSGKHRMVKASTRYQDFMQSDVAVNPGNSGGPLVNASGKLVGINTAIVGDTYRGVSFSIPSNVTKEVYKRLRETGRFERGWLGIALGEVPDELVIGDNHLQRGALITSLAGNESPAAVAGLRAGDIVQRINQELITDMGHLMRKIADLPAGTKIALDIQRNNQPLQVQVTIGARPVLRGE
jgi:serine protease Do